MSRVLFLYERDMPTVSIVRLQFMKLLPEHGICPVFQSILKVTQKEIDETDVLILIRPNDVLSWRIAQKAREAGCFVVVMCDDDLLNLPKSTASIPWRKNGLEKTLRQSHGIMSSSPYINEKYSKLTTDGRMIRSDTVVTAAEIQKARMLLEKKQEGPVKLVYAGAPSHVDLFDQHIRPIMPKIIERYGKDISFAFVGIRPDLAEFEGKADIAYVRGMPLEEYRKYMAEQSFDVGLAPLSGNEFSKCKYFNKFLEYSLQGIVGVYSDQEPYTYVVQNDKNGFLVEDGDINWFNSLSKAIEDRELRLECLKNAIDFLEQEFAPERILARLWEEFPELCSYKKRGTPCKKWRLGKLMYRISRPFDLAYLSWFELRTTGIRGFIKKTKTHLRERNAYK